MDRSPQDALGVGVRYPQARGTISGHLWQRQVTTDRHIPGPVDYFSGSAKEAPREPSLAAGKALAQGHRLEGSDRHPLPAQRIEAADGVAYHQQAVRESLDPLVASTQEWLAAQPPAKTIAGLQRQLSRFRRYYNDVRPHRALGRRTPWQTYTARPKATATGPFIDPHWRVRHDKIDKAGTVTLRHNSRMHHIGVGRALAGTRITLLVDDLHVRIIDRYTGELLRELTLDPTRDFQPRGVPPGPVRPPPHKR